ncbi:MAG TPA: hypothetical protein VGE15_07400 [Sphingobacteriaceae bacterium]
MEQFLPLIVGFLILAFRVYSNFQKEQEKVRKRDFTRPNQPEGHSSVPRVPEVTGSRPAPAPAAFPQEEVFMPYEPRYEAPKAEPRPREVYREPHYQPMRPLQVAASDGRSPEAAAEEIVRGRAIHARHPHQFEAHEESYERSAYADFDMEDAVIKAAILNRPEY